MQASERVDEAIAAGRFQEARSLVFHWLRAYLDSLPPHPSRRQLRNPDLWRALGDVVERTSDHHLLELFWQGMDRVRPDRLARGARIPLLGIPILNRPDLLERLLTSLDHPVDTLAIVDNSAGSGADPRLGRFLGRLERQGHPQVGTVRIARPFGNIGVAASWNLMLRAFPSASVACLLNNDVLLVPGVLGAAMALIEADQPQFLPLLPVPQEFSAFLITAPCWDRLGLFNADFYPAYCEDLDYRDRLRADPTVVWSEAVELQQAMAVANPHHSATIASDPALKVHNSASFALNRLWWLSHRRLRQDPRGTWLRQWLAEWKD